MFILDIVSVKFTAASKLKKKILKNLTSNVLRLAGVIKNDNSQILILSLVSKPLNMMNLE